MMETRAMSALRVIFNPFHFVSAVTCTVRILAQVQRFPSRNLCVCVCMCVCVCVFWLCERRNCKCEVDFHANCGKTQAKLPCHLHIFPTQSLRSCVFGWFACHAPHSPCHSSSRVLSRWAGEFSPARKFVRLRSCLYESVFSHATPPLLLASSVSVRFLAQTSSENFSTQVQCVVRTDDFRCVKYGTFAVRHTIRSGTVPHWICHAPALAKKLRPGHAP